MGTNSNRTLIAGLLVALALLGGVAWLDWRQSYRTQETADLVSHTHEVQANLNRLLTLMDDIETGQRGFVITGDPKFREPFDNGLTAVAEQQQRLRQLVLDPAQKNNLSALEPLIAERIAFAQTNVQARQNSGFEAAQKVVLSGKGKAIDDQIRARLAEMDAREQTLLEARSAAARREADTTRLLTITGEGLGVALLIAVFALVLRENRLRQQANLALRASEENLSVTLHSIGDAVLATDVEGRVTRMNVVAERLTGWTQAEAHGRPVGEVFHIINEKTRQPAVIPVDKVLATGEIHGLANDTVIIARDGTERPIADSAAPIHAQDGQTLGVVLVFRDVTAEHAAQQAVRESEERTRLATEAADIAVWEWDIKSGALKWDKRMFAIYGLPPKPDGRGNYEDWRARVLPDEIKEQEAQLQETVATCGRSQREFRITRASDQAVRVIQASEMAIAGADGKAARVVGINVEITEKKRLEEQVRASEALNRAVLNSMMANIAVVDKRGTIIAINEGWERFARENCADPSLPTVRMGANYLEVCERAVTDLGDGAQETLNGIKGVLAHSQETFKQEYACHSPTEKRWFIMQVSHLNRPEGGAVIAQINITERRKAEKALQESEERYRLLADTMLQGVVHQDAEGRIIEMNPAAERILGKTREQFLGSTSVREEHNTIRENGERFPGQEHPSMVALRTGQPVNGVVMGVLNPKLGNYRWISVNAVPLFRPGEPRAYEVYAVFEDITERKRVEQRLADFKAALDEHDIVSIADAGGKIAYVNDKFCAVSKYSREELLGQDHRVVNSGHHSKEFFRELWQTIGSGRVWKGQIKNRAKGGSYYWVKTSIVPFLGDDGKPAQYIGIRTDITEQKRAEEEIRKLAADLQARAGELEAANKELESFSYSVSHDLRAPLRHIHGYVEMLAKATAGQLSPKAERYLKTITDASVEMGQLIDDLLAFSRMGRVEMRETSVDLNQLVQQTLKGLELATKDRNITWKIVPLPPGLGDPAMLRQVFSNLIGNAVKYSRHRDPAEIEIGCAGDENGRRIYFVRDNGAGFDMQYVHKLFGVFQRLHRPEEFEGTGIGLATVRRILARHGDRIWAESEVDKGATFYFTLKPATSL